MKNKRKEKKRKRNKIGAKSIILNSDTESRSMNKTLYWVNTRELNRELCIGLSTLYTNS